MELYLLWFLLLAVVLLWFFRPRWSKGELGEFKVNSGIQRLLDQEEYRLIEDLTLPFGDITTQIDQVVISPYGIFVIETKSMSGWIFGSPDRAQWTQTFPRHKQKFQNPLRQNFRHVAAVQELLMLGSHQVFNVVVFVGDCTLKTPMPAEVVHGVSALAKFIKSKRVPLLAEYDLQGLVDGLLEHRLQPGSKTDLAHVQNVKRQASSDEVDAWACPRCGTTMIERSNKRSGERFMGCRQYPQCKGTRPLL